LNGQKKEKQRAKRLNSLIICAVTGGVNKDLRLTFLQLATLKIADFLSPFKIFMMMMMMTMMKKNYKVAG